MKTIQSILATSIANFEKIGQQIHNLRERSEAGLAPARKAFGAPEDKKEAEVFFAKLAVKQKKEILSAVKAAFNGTNPTEDKEKATANRVRRYTKALGLVLRVRGKEDELTGLLRRASEMALDRSLSLESFLGMAKDGFTKVKAKEEEQAD